MLLLLIIFLVGCADAAAGACAAYNISTEAERCAGYCFFLLRFCPLHCDASDVYCCCCSRLLLFLSFRLRFFGWLEKYKVCTPSASATTKRDIYVPDTYTKFSFSFSVWWGIPTSAFFHSRAFYFRVNRPHLNETVKHVNIRESDRHDRRYMYIPSFALPTYKTTCHAKPYLYRSVQYRYLSAICV